MSEQYALLKRYTGFDGDPSRRPDPWKITVYLNLEAARSMIPTEDPRGETILIPARWLAAGVLKVDAE